LELVPAEVARVAAAPRVRRRGCEGEGTGGRTGASEGRLAQSVPLLRNEKRPGRYRGASRFHPVNVSSSPGTPEFPRAKKPEAGLEPATPGLQNLCSAS